MNFKALVDGAMEIAVVPSFTDIGFKARRAMFGWEPLSDLRMAGRVVAITGATSGLGLAAAEMFAEMGASLRLLVRNPRSGEELASRLGSEASVHVVDMSDLSSVLGAVSELRAERLDVLINNAGALLTERKVSVDGFEMTFATMVLGPFVLTNGLVPALSRSPDEPPSRVINVASGGMYLEALHLDDLQMQKEPYRGSIAYARAKRAQVLLTQEWARRLREQRIVVHSMHPGWADTPGVEASLPTFRKVVGPLLRTPQQGADTMVWLAASAEAAESTGRFWHDRQPRPIDRVNKTRATPRERELLWEACERMTAQDQA